LVEEKEARPLTLTKQTWDNLDKIAAKYGYLSAQEIVRQCVAKIIKGEESPPE
jgi:hypothetical protein